MEFIGEAFLVKNGSHGLVIKATRRENLRARPGGLFGRLFGRCSGICQTRIIVTTPTPGDPGEETIDHVECDKGFATATAFPDTRIIQTAGRNTGASVKNNVVLAPAVRVDRTPPDE